MVTVNEEASKRITSLRFLLMLLVMIKHNAIVKDIVMHELPFYEPNVVTFIKEFFSNGLGELAVPLFFFFSGFLLASSDDKYLRILKKRFRSIFIPYTFWTVLYFAGWLALRKLGFNYETPVDGWREWSLYDYIVRFAGYYNGYIFTFVGSFWFLRDLMILIVLSPIIMFICRKIPVFTLFVFGISWFFLQSLIIILPVSIFFFSLGIVCCLYKIDLFKIADSLTWPEILLLYFFNYLFYETHMTYNENGGIHHSFYFFIFIFAGIIGILKLSSLIINNEKSFVLSKSLAVFTFFTYAFHMPILLEIVKRITFRITAVQTYGGAIRSLAQFVLACILDIGISLFAGFILLKICPSLFYLLSGGKRTK